MTISNKNRFEKLNSISTITLERATSTARRRTHFDVHLEHWIEALLDEPQSEFAQAIRSAVADERRLREDITRAIDRLRGGNSKPPSISVQVDSLVKYAFGEADGSDISSGHLLIAMIDYGDLQRELSAISPALGTLSVDRVRNVLRKVKPETLQRVSIQGESGESNHGAAGSSATPSLDKFSTDLTALAKAGKIDPVIGRDAEMRQMELVLQKKSQNNPLLLGEPGVGKTAVVEGFALRITEGRVAEPLRNVSLRSLDLGALQAGAGIKGEFETRLKGIIAEVKNSPVPIILFIDEIHTLIGAGGEQGVGDAVNLLKPALARGELRTIGATTWLEFKRHIESDPALVRRFQEVRLEEPSDDHAKQMLRGIAVSLERHHKVKISQGAIDSAVTLSRKFIPSRQLPDKARTLLDAACARVAVGHSGTPASVEDLERGIQLLEARLHALRRESAAGTDHSSIVRQVQDELIAAKARLESTKLRWQQELELVKQLNSLRAKLDAAVDTNSDVVLDSTRELANQISTLKRDLASIQGESPLVSPMVDDHVVAQVVSNWTGIPAGRMLTTELTLVRALEQHLEQRVIGQSAAIHRMSEELRNVFAGINDPRRPRGVFMLLGTSGVGKTETAKAIADALYGGEHGLCMLNMAEYKSDETAVNRLLGPPPGYVGYPDDGTLTGPIRRRPYSAVLLDEMEKAHRKVQDIFYQMFDEGRLKDGTGRTIDCRNTTVFMTSNAGSELLSELCSDQANLPTPEVLKAKMKDHLERWFDPAFLGRCEQIFYYPLGVGAIEQIVQLQLRRLGARITATYGATFEVAPEVAKRIAQQCTLVQTGARHAERVISSLIMPPLASQLLARLADGVPVGRVRVGLDHADEFSFEVM